jgi:carbamoyl-phosphate synthase large subunit
MPKRTDIKSILIIGAGPIVIGQACEFDYSGSQACKILRAEGYRIVLVNSNPATIMTDPNLADATYVEPITPEIVEKIIAREKPDALLPTMGGQTALNCAKALAESGVLAKYNVELIGAKLDSINKAEDRLLFGQAMARIGLEVPKNAVVKSLAEAREARDSIGLPAVIRPSFTMGGSGGGIAYNHEEFDAIVSSGLDASPVGEVMIDESVLGWKEYEMEVVRDKADNCIIICSIENVDPMGVHTGDSITVAPALTLTDKEYQIMRDASFAVLREIGVDTGGSNVQFAVNPNTGRMLVIEMNPRVSRSSALASKATGFPIAKVAAKLAVGYTLDEIQNDITGGATPASFEPTIDYIVTKIPRFTFEKFPGTEPLLTTAMKSVGEAMAMGRNFTESLQKCLRSLEIGLTGLDEVTSIQDADTARSALTRPTPDRLLVAAQALRVGLSVEEICAIAKFDPWFVRQLETIVEMESGIRDWSGKDANQSPIPNPKSLSNWKRHGFSDARIAKLAGCSASEITALREKLNIRPVYKRVDTCAAEFASNTPYMYSSYEGNNDNRWACESEPTNRKKIVILGGGPNRIGQGIEFDYCCVHACYALKEAGFETIMINCNPETVSTDYDTADRLYFEPMTAEDVINVIRKEQGNGEVVGCIVQFGGQTPLKLAYALQQANIPILGTTLDSIDLTEDRERFHALVEKLKLKQPKSATATTRAQVIHHAENIGFPVLVRPSHVLGGRAMETIYDVARLHQYLDHTTESFGAGKPLLIDSFLKDAIEVDVDAIADGKEVFIAGIMQHIEEAGIHSGDSACALPPYSLNADVQDRIARQTAWLARELKVVGLMNVQYAIKDDEIYIIEVNPRASRTVPFVAKTIGVPVAKIAAQIMAGKTLNDFGLEGKKWDPSTFTHVAVKEAVFPFARFPGVDVILGPEMKSTGEVMGIDKDFPSAFAKSQLGAGTNLPKLGTIFISVRDADKTAIIGVSKDLVALGYKLIATRGTAQHLATHGVQVEAVNKVREGRPHIVDYLKDRQVHLVINTTEGAKSIADSFDIRRTALLNKIPYYTTLSEAIAAVHAMRVLHAPEGLNVTPLQQYQRAS